MRTHRERIAPDVITETTAHDTDDPAIWINQKDPSASLVFGTDKRTSDGGIYAFDLQGKIVEEKTIKGLKRPNNVDITYDFEIDGNKKVDLMAFTERGREQVRLFSIPDMRPLDNGGFPVFEDEKEQDLRKPMGISFYKSPASGEFYLIVGRKEGPQEKYLYQYRLEATGSKVDLVLVRKFGNFSGKKEIEAIAVDDELGFVYYSDEAYGIRKYHAEPSGGAQEVSCFGNGLFERDVEGIAIAATGKTEGFILVSNQQENTFNVFSRSKNDFIKEIDLGTDGSDGCDLEILPLNEIFPTGLFVAMNDAKNFYFYDYSKLNLEEE